MVKQKIIGTFHDPLLDETYYTVISKKGKKYEVLPNFNKMDRNIKIPMETIVDIKFPGLLHPINRRFIPMIERIINSEDSEFPVQEKDLERVKMFQHLKNISEKNLEEIENRLKEIKDLNIKKQLFLEKLKLRQKIIFAESKIGGI